MVSHPAKFTDALLPIAARMLLDAGLTDDAIGIDPFAGTGKGCDWFHEHTPWLLYGIELEPEWAAMSEWVEQGDALHLPEPDDHYEFFFTSPAYGNRMADKDMRPSVAGTYAKSLGRFAGEGSSCHLQWGDKYRAFHEQAIAELTRVVKPGGLGLLNMKDHMRGGAKQEVVSWWDHALVAAGWWPLAARRVRCPGNRNGRNGQSRVDYELLLLFRRPV